MNFTDGQSFTLVQLDEEGVWLACEKGQLSRQWLKMIGQMIQSQVGNFKESVSRYGLRFTRYVIDVYM